MAASLAEEIGPVRSRDPPRRYADVRHCLLLGTILIVGALLFLPSRRSARWPNIWDRFPSVVDRRGVKTTSQADYRFIAFDVPRSALHGEYDAYRIDGDRTLRPRRSRTSRAGGGVRLLTAETGWAGAKAIVRDAAAGHPVEEPCDVRGRSRGVLDARVSH